MLADIRRRFMSKEAIFSPDFSAPDDCSKTGYLALSRNNFESGFRTPVRFPKWESNWPGHHPFGGYGSIPWLSLFWIFPSLPWM